MSLIDRLLRRGRRYDGPGPSQHRDLREHDQGREQVRHEHESPSGHTAHDAHGHAGHEHHGAGHAGHHGHGR